MKILKIILSSLAIVILSAGLALGYKIAANPLDKANKKVDSNKIAEAKENLKATSPFTGDDPLHILLFGIDKTATTDMTEEGNPTRSDVIMLLTIDPVSKRAQLLSLPRDTYVDIEGHKGKTKLGHAYAYGGEELAEKTVERFLDVSVDYYATVDYNAVRRLVDAVGGIEVDIPFDYTYEDTYVVPHLYINFKKGKQKLNGDDAVRYLRIRKIYENQDLDRIQTQQGFLMKLFDKLKSPRMIFKIPELIDLVMDNVETNLSYGQIAYLAKMGLDFDKDSIQMDTLVGENKRIGKLEYYVVDRESAREQLKRFWEGKGSYYEETTEKSEENSTDNQTEEE
ncbi:cell envelope-like function transcriptional attenuator common domain protein [Aedoeadaptatus coxii]|uniref:Cell envelope-like function transcriptional attenuator common domain protein n=1 Tax=Aedoeadaptatus coxii TaxID=755172 RepID=A0A134AJV1_9FIRM|nr:LCP family protein [Peptoniphilus coxii]KXB68001.1 cell envelope-like function transcriptional attenuator common domain protein [Peptoniphilus coxii]CAC9924848.1 cell envelope-like function transcriptional attenuator common domain protein [Peptoniphilus coxii]